MKRLFYDRMSLNLPDYLKHSSSRNIDSMLRKMELDEDNPERIEGLEVQIVATHAFRVTGHNHFYMPSKVKKASDSFLQPYKKPILKHHNEMTDAIGRIQTASYIPTPHPSIPYAVMQKAETDAKHTASYLKFLKPYFDVLRDRRFPGLGYEAITALVTDKDSIQKIVDERYLTVSVGYDTNSIHCSKCFRNWATEERCDHYPGEDGMFLIFGDLEYFETSFVNTPADELAMVTGATRQTLVPSSDAGKNKEFTDASIKKFINDLGTSTGYTDSVGSSLYMFNSNTDTHLPLNMLLDSNAKQGDHMKQLTDLFALSMADFYEKLKQFLPKDTAIDISKADSLVFAGKNNTFPCIDEAHADACLKMLDEVEASSEKDNLIVKIGVMKASLKKDTATTPSTEEKKKTPDSTTNTDASVVYTFTMKDGTWIAENKNQSIENDIARAILESSISNTDFASEILSMIQKAHDTKFPELVGKLGVIDNSTKELQAKVDSLIKENKQFSKYFDAQIVIIKEHENEIKESLIDKILQYQDKADPNINKEQERDFYRKKRVDSLRDSLETLNRTVGGGNDKVIEPVEDPTLKTDESDPKKKITELEKTLESEFKRLLSQGLVDNANAYRTYMVGEINRLKSKVDNTDSVPSK